MAFAIVVQPSSTTRPDSSQTLSSFLQLFTTAILFNWPEERTASCSMRRSIRILLRSAIVLELCILRNGTVLRSKAVLWCWCIVILRSWLVVCSLLDIRWLMIILLKLLLDRYSWWCTIMHPFIMRWLLADEGLLLALSAFDFLVLLGQVAWRTTACHQTISTPVAFQAIFLSDFSSLHHLDDPLERTAGQRAIPETVHVEHTEVLELSILVESVLYSSVRDTWYTPRQQACTLSAIGLLITSRQGLTYRLRMESSTTCSCYSNPVPSDEQPSLIVILLRQAGNEAGIKECEDKKMIKNAKVERKHCKNSEVSWVPAILMYALPISCARCSAVHTVKMRMFHRADAMRKAEPWLA